MFNISGRWESLKTEKVATREEISRIYSNTSKLTYRSSKAYRIEYLSYFREEVQRDMMQTDIFEYIEGIDDDLIEEAENYKLIVSVILGISKFERLNFHFKTERQFDEFIKSLEIESMKESQVNEGNEKFYILLVHRNKFIKRYMKGNKGE